MITGVFAENVNIQWKTDAFNVTQYEDIFFDRIDVRDMRTKDYEFVSIDDEGGSETEDYIDPRILSELAMAMYDRFSHRLDGTILVNQEEQLEEGRNSLVLRMKLSAEFDIESRGFLNNLIAETSQPTEITLKCFLTEALTEDEILHITLKNNFLPQVSEEPLSTIQDMSKMSELFDAWAYRFVMVLLNNLTNEDLR